MIWSRYWVLAPWAGAALVFVGTVVLASVIQYRTPLLDAPDYALERLFPALTAPPSPRAEAAPAPRQELPAPVASRFTALVREQRARLNWAVAALMLVLALALSLSVPWWLTYEALQPLGGRRRAWILGALALSLAIGFLVSYREEVILPHLLQVMIDALSDRLKLFREVIKAFSLAAILGIVCAISASLWPGERSLEHIAAQTRRLRVVLLIAAALLVAGVLEVSFLLHWPVARLDAADAAAVRLLADTVSVATGAMLSLLLVATYGVAAAVLLQRARQLSEPIEPQKRTAWFAEKGLTAMPGQLLLRVLAMLAPLIAGGPVTALIEALAG